MMIDPPAPRDRVPMGEGPISHRMNLDMNTVAPTWKCAAILSAALVIPTAPPQQEAGPKSSSLIDSTIVRPAATVKTEPVARAGDAADDPAIWVHPTDPARSLVLGTDKKGGLHAYDFDGRCVQVVSPEWRPNNVDVLYGFRMGGTTVDLAVAGSRSRAHPGDGHLTPIGAGPAFTVLDGGEPYGSCVYREPRTGTSFVFVTSKDGRVEQYRLDVDSSGRSVRGTLVRTLRLGSQVEGCVVDQELGYLYVGEEDVGIWKFAAGADAPRQGRLIARVGEHGLTADVEGLTIYYAGEHRGYLIASSQGSNTFLVYDRAGDNPYVLTIDPAAGAVDDVEETDGIDVTNRAIPPRFPAGVFVVQDGRNPAGNQDYKFFSWSDIAGRRLRVDTDHPVPGR
jgi:3-phytase